MLILVLLGAAVIAAAGYFVFGLGIRNGQVAVVTTLGMLATLVVAQFIRHRQRVSLRTLMIVISLLAIGLTFTSRWIATVRRERIAMEILVDRGGRVSYGQGQQIKTEFFEAEGGWYLPEWIHDWLGDDYFMPLRDVSFINADVTDEDLELLGEIRGAEWIRLANPKITPQGLAAMPLPPSVERLSLYADQLTSESAAHLSELPELKCVSIMPQPPSPALMMGPTMPVLPPYDIRPLRHFRQVEELRLRLTSVDEQGMQALAELPKLRTLFLGCSMPNVSPVSALAELHHSRSLRSLTINLVEFSDKELAALQDLSSLERLELASTAVTAAGVRDFRAARPNVRLILTTPVPGL